MPNYEMLEHRIDCFITLQHNGYLSMAMMMVLMSELSHSMGICEKDVMSTLNDRLKLVKKTSTVKFYIDLEGE